MRFIKLALISFIFLFLLVTVMSLFIPSHIRISRAINIKAEKDSIMAQIKDAGRWKNWYPGVDTAKLFYENGIVKGVVFDDKDPDRPIYIHITKEAPDEINAEFISKKMRPVINGWRTISYSTNDSITLQWYMDFHLRWYPWEKFSSLVLEKSYGSKMERGLSTLKQLLQEN
jgi:Polyketide cyclase / dehydrase and lipid transport